MSVVQIAGQNRDVMGVDQATIDEFRAGLRGIALQPGDDGYDEARTIWNEMIDHRPNLIIRCAGVSDVIAVVNFARSNALLVSVRGGGHNVSGNAVCDGGLMIDLSLMKSIHVDVATRTARAEGGATWKDYDRETQTFGLASTGGAVSRTGVAGLTLGGGWGWLSGRHGLACDNLLSADVVTADGQLMTVSADQYNELFWGLRGGGGNFGVVTSFEYQVHPVGEVLGGVIWHPLDDARDVLTFYDKFTESSPDDLVSLVQFATLPDMAAEVPLTSFEVYAGRYGFIGVNRQAALRNLQTLKDYRIGSLIEGRRLCVQRDTQRDVSLRGHRGPRKNQ